MDRKLRDQTIALAGVVQAAALVDEIAREGRCDSEALRATIESILITTPGEAADIFGGVTGVRYGLEQLTNQFGNDPTRRNMQQTRYLVALLHLERKLSRRRDMLDAIADGIERARAQAAHFGSNTHPSVIANLADLYAETVSTIPPRIMVAGAHGHLTHPDNANKVRALLLGGIRAAVLWAQSGGGRLRLLFGRHRYLEAATALRVSP